MRVNQTPAAGWYPDPAGEPDEQRWWDGQAWTAETAPREGPQPPTSDWAQSPMAFLGHCWFRVVLLATVIATAGAIGYNRTGNRLGALAAAISSSVGACAAFGLFVDSRLRLRQVTRPAALVLVGAVGGGIAMVAATFLEEATPSGGLWTPLVGPIEVTCILALPVALAVSWPARFANPRPGIAIVLATAAVFAIVEGVGYDFMPVLGHEGRADFDGTLLLRMVGGCLHMVWTGMAAAVIWRTWHLRGGPCVSWGVLGAVLLAWGLHGAYDTFLSLQGAVSGLAGIVIVISYFAFKLAARQHVPPDVVPSVPPGWRPGGLRPEPPSKHRQDDPHHDTAPVPGRA
ncbi:MAG: hypothetical protein JJLCMIEE_01982 [Acidimicrobiales bacterium]|nr:hypothetical protein [Acidimicrobiales bacterium]